MYTDICLHEKDIIYRTKMIFLTGKSQLLFTLLQTKKAKYLDNLEEKHSKVAASSDISNDGYYLMHETADVSINTNFASNVI